MSRLRPSAAKRIGPSGGSRPRTGTAAPVAGGNGISDRVPSVARTEAASRQA
jgi:hypothetical protein